MPALAVHPIELWEYRSRWILRHPPRYPSSFVAIAQQREGKERTIFIAGAVFLPPGC